MNRVKNIPLIPNDARYEVDDFIGKNFNDNCTAFIGECGNGEPGQLYLITHDSVSLANNPRQTWDKHANIKVNRFVDIIIEVIEC